MASRAFPATAGGQAAMADINITPLVDVMLVLLIIFMVTMPMRSESLSLTLPGVSPPTTPVPEPVQLAVRGDGSVSLDGTVLALAELPQALRAQHAQAPQAAVQLQSSGEADYQVFAQVLAATRDAGYQNVAIKR